MRKAVAIIETLWENPQISIAIGDDGIGELTIAGTSGTEGFELSREFMYKLKFALAKYLVKNDEVKIEINIID